MDQKFGSLLFIKQRKEVNIIAYQLTWDKRKPISEDKQSVSWETWENPPMGFPAWGDKVYTICKEHKMLFQWKTLCQESEQHGPGAQLPDGRAWGRRVTVSDEWKNCMPLGCLSQMFYLATKLLLRIGQRTVWGFIVLQGL